jgi:5-methylcytosine-specific restriction endonuclease McrA
MKKTLLTSFGFEACVYDWASWKHGNDQNIKRAIKYSGEVAVDNTVTRDVLALFYYSKKCAYCGKRCGKKSRSIDHLTPLSRGGKHSIHNIVLACKGCNTEKDNMTLIEYILTKRETQCI